MPGHASIPWLAGALWLLGACADGDGLPEASGPDPGREEPAGPEPGELGDCQGFEVEGLRYSPGGTVLPNTCEPFHPVTNNPYAIRCVDAMPGYETPFAGDQWCVLPPPPDKGIHVGVHPQEHAYWEQMWAGDYSGYVDPDPEQWVLQPGDEVTQNYRITASTDEPLDYYRVYFRMRTGSHHNIITLHSTGPEGWQGDRSTAALPGFISVPDLVGTLGGQQRADDGIPSSFDKPPEDDGLFQHMPARPNVLFNMHHFNTTDEPLLREGWVNIWKEEDARTEIDWYVGLDFDQVSSLSLAPGDVADLHYTAQPDQEVRLLRLFGHRHAWTTNFSAWIERMNGETEIVYQSFDWFDMPTYRYDSVTANPESNPAALADGASSGVLSLNPGDTLHFNCHLEFTEERALATGAPMPGDEITEVRFANEVYSGEMCILFGTHLGPLPGPTADTSPVPDFAR